MRKHNFLVFGAVLLAGTACDRREDPAVDPASTGSSTPPGEMVDATPEPAPATSPAGTPPPVVAPASCEGRAGTEGCPPADDARVPTDPQPPQTPPEPR